MEKEQDMFCDHVLTYQEADRPDQNRAMKLVNARETNLIEAAQRGDVSAFNQLVLAYQDDIYGWVASLVWDAATAEDITQHTFVTAYQKIPTFRGGSLRAWLFRIARNRSFDEMRYHQRRPTVSLDGDPQDEETIDKLSVLPADAPLPEEAVIQSEQTGWLMQLLDMLPEPFRQALQLVDLYEMDYQEAAGVLGLPLGTVKSRVARARARMHELILQHPEWI